MRAIRARLAFVSETTIPILSISGIRRYWAVPSASEIAVLTLRTPMTFSTRATSRTATQTAGPKAASGEHRGVDDRDRDDRGEAELGEVERELDRALAAIEDEGERRSRRARAAMNAGGETRKSPATSGSSLIENECALRPMCRWMTFASAR